MSSSMNIATTRLISQRITGAITGTVAELVTHLGAVQAQDYPGALWSLGLRLPGTTKADIEAAINRREIIRTWPMRGTLHFVPAEDARWMLELLAPRIMRTVTTRMRGLGIDEVAMDASRAIVRKALKNDKILTREQLFAVLTEAGQPTAGQRGIHIVQQMALEQLICFGPHDAKQPTFVWLDDWVPAKKVLSREESLAELARRYVTSHGPVQEKDFASWAGLNLSDTRRALATAGRNIASLLINGATYWLTDNQRNAGPQSPASFLLPGFDEFMLGYSDRTAALHPDNTQKIVPGLNGMFLPTIVINGQVRGTWKKLVKAKSIVIEPRPFERLSAQEIAALQPAVQNYAHFMGLPVAVEVSE